MNESNDERVAKELVDEVNSRTHGIGDGGVRRVLEKIIEALKARLDQIPHPDNTLPGNQAPPQPDNTLPDAGKPARPDNTLPGKAKS